MNRLSFQKVFYHIDQLYDFYKNEDTYPVHLTIGLTSFCNHKCLFCYADYETSNPHKNFTIDSDRLLRIIQEAYQCGLKSISLVGTGEPLLHSEIVKIIRGIRTTGIDLAIYTNGVMLKRMDILDAVLDCCTWIRISINAANADEHEKVHQVQGDFDLIVENIFRMVKLRNKRGQTFPTIGCQFVAYEDNFKSIFDAAKLWKKIGVDYFAIKPMYRQEKNAYKPMIIENYSSAEALMRKTTELTDDRYHVYAKFDQFKEVLFQDKNRGYDKCYGHAFTSAILADGHFYLCGNLHSEDQYSFGCIYKNNFMEIWQSEKRKQVVEAINLKNCPVRCRNHPLNLILWDLKHPDPAIHPNFL